jgi:hypothetical protein
MSRFKDQTGNTPPSSSGENTEVLERPSSLSVSTDNTQTSTQTTNQPLQPMLPPVLEGLTTPPTTEKTRQHAMVLRVALSYLMRAGLVKQYKVLSPDGATVLKLRFEFDLAQWTKDLHPK